VENKGSLAIDVESESVRKRIYTVDEQRQEEEMVENKLRRTRTVTNFGAEVKKRATFTAEEVYELQNKSTGRKKEGI
jgi:3-oxoacyl-[acyl-carrier-protein] synthase III